MTAPPRTRRRVRLVRLAVVAMLLPVAYVASWLTLSRLVNHGVVSPGIAQSVRPVYRPLIIYCDLQQPGAGALTQWWWTVCALHEDGIQQQGWFLGPQYPTLGIDE